MKNNKIIAGNWKMNGCLADNHELLERLKGKVAASVHTVIVFPPNVYLGQVHTLIDGSAIKLGAQNLSDKNNGAYTGEVSAQMLKDIGCSYVLVGHSERRSLYAETDLDVAHKFLAAKNAGITPILCVGETMAERERGETNMVIARQLNVVIDYAGIDAFENTLVAYEPVWAIGTGLTASPEQAEAAHEFIYYTFALKSDTISRLVNVLYGGSVKASSARGLFEKDNINGALVGGASLDAEEFANIVLAASE